MLTWGQTADLRVDVEPPGGICKGHRPFDMLPLVGISCGHALVTLSTSPVFSSCCAMARARNPEDGDADE